MTDERFGPGLSAELEDLRARLAEAEDALRAIRNGEVDAVVVSGGRGGQVYTLGGADRIYRQLIETMSEGAVTLSTNGVILYCNARVAKMLGRPLEQVIGTDLRDYLPPADRQALDAILAQAHTEPSRREINIKTGDGRLASVHLSVTPLICEGASMVFCLVLTNLTEQKRREAIESSEELARELVAASDRSRLALLSLIEDQKQAEDALRESETRYRALFEHSTDGILIADLEKGFFRFANPALCRMLGYTDQELKTLGVQDIHPKEALPDVMAAFEAIARGEKMWAMDVPCLRKDGTIFHVDISGIRVVLDGGPCLVGFFRNITERKRADEERAKLTQQLAQVHKLDAVGQLAGGVAHDFNNILSIIMSSATFLLDDLPADSPLRADATEIKKAGQRATALTRQLLSFSRKQTVVPQVIAVDDAVKNIVKMLARLIGEHIELKHTPAMDGACILMDPSQFEQILINLAVNSRDAMPGGGVFTITTEITNAVPAGAAGPDEIAPGEHVMVTVSDTGTGMTADVRDKIFEPFFTTKPVGKGTGLGLSIVYGAVTQNGGHILVESEPMKGTTFKLYFSRHAPGAAGDAPGTGDIRPTATASILLVEDEEPVRRVTARILRGAGHTVTEAYSGQDGLDKYRDTGARFDIVITDVIMPVMGGVEMVAAIRALNPAQKIAFQSGYTDDMMKSQGVLKKGDVLLTKPVPKEELLKTVRNALVVKG